MEKNTNTSYPQKPEKKLSFVQLDRQQVEEVYEKLMKRDFPVPELKPLDSILHMLDRGTYECLGVQEDGDPSGYVYMVMPPGLDFCLIDYFAVFPEKRNGGLGGRILKLLKERYSDRCILLESEYPPGAPDPVQAEQRMRFYLRNGVKDTGVRSTVFTVEYVNLALTDEVREKAEYLEAFQKIYEAMVPNPEHRKKNLDFR